MAARLRLGGSSTIPYGNWSATGENSPYNSKVANGSFVVDPQTGEVRKYNGQQDAYNFAPASYLVSPQDLFTINAVANYDITRDLRVFMEGATLTDSQTN